MFNSELVRLLSSKSILNGAVISLDAFSILVLLYSSLEKTGFFLNKGLT